MTDTDGAMTVERIADRQSILLLEAREAFAVLGALLRMVSEDVDGARNDLVVEQINGASALAFAMRTKLKKVAHELDKASLRHSQMSREAEAPAT